MKSRKFYEINLFGGKVPNLDYFQTFSEEHTEWKTQLQVPLEHKHRLSSLT